MSELIQVLGLVCVVAGLWLWLGFPAGLIASGVGLYFVGEAVDR